MRRFVLIFLGGILGWAAPAQAQFSKRISLQAGSPEDKAYSEIVATTDPARKLALIDKFMADYGKGEMATVAFELYMSHYLAEKNYTKAFEYGEKLVGADPDNLLAGVNLVRVAQEAADREKVFAYGERVGGMLARFNAQAAGPGMDATQWATQKDRALAEAQDNLNYVQYTMFSTAYQTRDTAQRVALLERFLEAFPVSPYATNAQALVAASYQQTRNLPKMLEFAQKILARDPDNVNMLILLADYYSERGEQLDKAEADGKRAIKLLASAPKPEGISDDQWQKQVAIQKGLALSALGQVYINRKHDTEALESFRSAVPLLKADSTSYARNKYRMGFALLNLKRVPEARAALTEAASTDNPYRPLAQEKLKSLPASSARATKKGSS